ncbi:MAG: type 1 glutamine amidotransferase domain-containing protein [Pseudomonadota bacterium]
MALRAQDKKLAILATSGFEQVELSSPKEAIENAGGQTFIVSPTSDRIQGNKHRELGDWFDVDVDLAEAKASDYDALLIPGGLFNPDALRTSDTALGFVRDFFAQKKPVFSICHGPQVLISADLVKGRRMTGYSAIQKDLENAGAIVSDEAVIVDQGLVTSRNPDDLEAFNDKIVEEICEGRHDEQDQSIAA